MLILSRRPNEMIRFPQLGISVSIVSVKGSRVQVGIDAPPEIQILRRELETDGLANSVDAPRSLKPLPGLSRSQASASAAGAKSDSHDLRNRLNKATLGLHLAQKQLATGQVEAADRTLAIALARLAELEESHSIELISPSTESTQSRSNAIANLVERAGYSNTFAHRGDRKTMQHPDVTVGSSNESQECIDVLLVEDDPNERALLRGLLEMEGYRVHTAANGHEAISCLDRVQPKFVLLDMLMPECDGRETLERIREIPAFAELPIFAVSGSSPSSVGLAIGKDGVADWFPKPLNAPRLVQHLRDRIGNLCT